MHLVFEDHPNSDPSLFLVMLWIKPVVQLQGLYFNPYTIFPTLNNFK